MHVNPNTLLEGQGGEGERWNEKAAARISVKGKSALTSVIALS